jgi:ParB family transcriptional regulator, chromosome partitioning protein
MNEPAKKRGLGRGLSALLGEDKAPPEPGARGEMRLRIDQIHPGRFQPRKNFDDENMKTLVDSVIAQGILQPILVRPYPGKPGAFEILAGERRWRAAQKARLHEVPAVLRDLGDREALEIALVENIQRQDLTPIEEAFGYKRLIDEFKHTQDALASALGKSRSHVANTLRLLNLPAPVQQMLGDGRLSAGHARALVTARDPAALARKIIEQEMNVRQAEGLVKTERGGKKIIRKNPDTLAIERELSRNLGLKVSIAHGSRGGTLSIRYLSLDQLDEVLKKLRAKR